MGLNCGASLIKYVLFVFNLICAVGGIALVVVGAIALKKVGDVEHVFDKDNHPGFFPAAIVALGALVFVIAFFGCCGAIRESQCLLNLYALCLLVIVVLQVLLAIFVFVYNDDILKAAEKGWDKIWIGRATEINQKTIDQIQLSLECCGSVGVIDYIPNIPKSCCPSDSASCLQLNVFTSGCKSKINDVFTKSVPWIAYFSIAMAIVELVGVIFGCCLSSNIRNSSRYA